MPSRKTSIRYEVRGSSSRPQIINTCLLSHIVQNLFSGLYGFNLLMLIIHGLIFTTGKGLDFRSGIKDFALFTCFNDVHTVHKLLSRDGKAFRV